ncbi:MAG: hypothetical protein FJX25_19430, partial [Alphaproteobacteria bacterium]|nr:hypothetical protein [Alphaproteobacteria bacterium]
MKKPRILSSALRKVGPSISGNGSQRSAASPKQQAEAARARGDWAADVYYRRQVCERAPDRANHWLQYGHALKEAGFYARAEQAYLKARDLSPEDAEILVQLGHLSKVRGDIEFARDRFLEARQHPEADAQFLDTQIRTLSRAARGGIFRSTASGAKQGVRYFLSAPGKAVLEASPSEISETLSRPDHPTSFAMRAFLDAFQAIELEASIIENPEFIADIRERSDAAINVHLGFHPPEQLRLLKGAYNISCFSWAFDRLRHPGEVISYNAFADQAAMLDRPDEIWIPSVHGQRALAPAVSRPLKVVPAPVAFDTALEGRQARPSQATVERAARKLTRINWEPLAIVPRIQSTLDSAARSRRETVPSLLFREDARPTIFVSVFNACDIRKQIEPMLRGFVAFSESRQDAILLLKVTTPDRVHESANVSVMRHQLINAANLVSPCVSDRVWLTNDALTRDEMNSLYDVADHYLCTSSAESQNLPLLEAMGRGVVPVSVDHTAMAEYISVDGAIVIPTNSRA